MWNCWKRAFNRKGRKEKPLSTLRKAMVFQSFEKPSHSLGFAEGEFAGYGAAFVGGLYEHGGVW